jgi:hypothetical protein
VHAYVEPLRPLEVLEVTGAADHDEFGVGDRLLELACDVEPRTRVQFVPDQQGRRGAAGQQVALSASAITNDSVLRLSRRTAANISLSSETNSGGGSPANGPGGVGSNSSAGPPCKARDVGREWFASTLTEGALRAKGGRL